MPMFNAVFEWHQPRWFGKSVPKKSTVVINAADLLEAMRIARSDARAHKPRARITVTQWSEGIDRTVTEGA